MSTHRVFCTPAGLTISVGKSASGNHSLTLASEPDDFWLHAESFPGSHVVMSGRATVSDIAFAADLAVFFSKARARGKTPVTVARVSDVSTRKDGSATVAALHGRVVGNPIRGSGHKELECA